jgi:hypothetical protein
MWKRRALLLFAATLLLLSPFLSVSSVSSPSIVKGQEPQQRVFGNPSLPSWKNVTVTVAGDGKSFTLDNADNLTWTFQYGANKYDSIYQNGVQIVKDELWMLQVYDGSWKDIGSSVNVFYEQVASYNIRVTQTYTSANGDYNVTWDFYGGFRPKISFVADITVAGNYRIDWRTYVYKDYAENMTNYVRFWNSNTFNTHTRNIPIQPNTNTSPNPHTNPHTHTNTITIHNNNAHSLVIPLWLIPIIVLIMAIAGYAIITRKK